MKTKSFHAPLTVKSAQSGLVECVFATLQVWDHDNDFTMPGAFGVHENVILEGWNHDHGLPVGKGRVFERGNEAIFSGRFFLETQPGRDHFEVVKELRPEFSYTFDILDAKPTTNAGRAGRILRKLDVWGVAPVTRAAGIATRVLDLKGRSKTTQDLFAEVDDLEIHLGYIKARQHARPGLSRLDPRRALAEIERIVFHASVDEQVDDIKRSIRKAKGRPKSGLESYRQELIDEGYSEALADVYVQVAVQERAWYLRETNPHLYFWSDDQFVALAASQLRQPA